jgi:hypothetical protein
MQRNEEVAEKMLIDGRRMMIVRRYRWEANESGGRSSVWDQEIVFSSVKCVQHIVIKMHRAFKKQDNIHWDPLDWGAFSGLVLELESAMHFYSTDAGLLRSWRWSYAWQIQRHIHFTR